MSVARPQKKAPHRPRPWRKWIPWILWACCFSVALWLIRESFREAEPVSVERRCSAPWPTLKQNDGMQVCITTLSDAKIDSKFSKAARRNFSDILDATWNNKMQYAAKHKYFLFNASELVDIERPPSWSKILAVQDALRTDCDWVFWMDPDSLIMNSEIRIEEILPLSATPDLIITRDATGFNAGMWMIRKSKWASAFLNEWWSMTSFIRQPGDTKSGDNDALKAFLGQMDDLEDHVLVAPQCVFNSYLWTPGIKSWRRYLWDKKTITDGIYMDGDFLIHFAGVDDKMRLIQKFAHNI